MIENKLRVGEPRLCRLVDGNPNTPEAVVMLQDTGDAIETTFPLSGMAGPDDGPYDRWWSQGIRYGDDPNREKYSYAPPSTMLLYDSDGCVVLVGCRATRGINGLAAGAGVVVADFAVLGAKNIKYDRINGMRTESPAFLRWIRRTAIEVGETTDETGLLQSMRNQPSRDWLDIAFSEAQDVNAPALGRDFGSGQTRCSRVFDTSISC